MVSKCSLLIFKCSMSHGTMKYTLKAHVCYFVLMGSYTICTHSKNGPTILKLIVRIYKTIVINAHIVYVQLYMLPMGP